MDIKITSYVTGDQRDLEVWYLLIINNVEIMRTKTLSPINVYLNAITEKS